MERPAKRVRVATSGDLLGAIEDLKSDGVPRVLEQDGEDVAVLVSPTDFGEAGEPRSQRHKEKLLALAGAWKDIDTDLLIDEVYRARHESPPSAPVNL